MAYFLILKSYYSVVTSYIYSSYQSSGCTMLLSSLSLLGTISNIFNIGMRGIIFIYAIIIVIVVSIACKVKFYYYCSRKHV